MVLAAKTSEWVILGLVGIIPYFHVYVPMSNSAGYMMDKRTLSSMDSYAQSNGPYDRRVKTYPMKAEACPRGKI